MEAQTFIMDKITYNRKEIDKGLILGERPFRWTLKRKYSPCWAKEIDGEYVSELSPHKRNFKIYIPIDCLKEGSLIHIFKRDYKQESIDVKIKIVKVDGNTITLIKKEE